MFTTFNYWTYLAPAGLLLALVLGWLSVRRKLCHVYNHRVDGFALIVGIAAGIGFGYMVFRESFVGAIDFAERHFFAPGENTALALPCAVFGIVFCACAYGVMVWGLVLIGNWLHAKLAAIASLKQRERCRKAKSDYELMQKLVKKCTRATPGHGYCKVGHITGAYDEKPKDEDIPDLTDAQLARVEAASIKPERTQVLDGMWSSTVTVGLHLGEDVDPSIFKARPRVETHKVILDKRHVTQLRRGTAKAKTIFARQAADGQLQACVVTLDKCEIRFDPARSLSEEGQQAWDEFLDLQKKPLDLPHVG